MKTTMDLLALALDKAPAADWHRQLKLSRNALHNAKLRGNLSPAIAWSLAEAIGENPQEWALIAAAESERDSACKTHMLRRITQLTAAGALAAFATAGHAAVCVLCKVSKLAAQAMPARRLATI